MKGKSFRQTSATARAYDFMVDSEEVNKQLERYDSKMRRATELKM